MTDKPIASRDPIKPTPIADVPGAINSWDYTHSEIVDTPIVINGYTEIETQHGVAFVTECIIKDEVVQVLMGGVVLMHQLAACKEAFPVSATVINTGKYFILN